MTKLHTHEWILRNDANGRQYAYCRGCPEIVHAWEAKFRLLKIGRF